MSKLRTIPFSEFFKWDVKRYQQKSNLSFENVVRLSDILVIHKQVTTKEEMIKNKWQIIKKINFGGELFLREVEEIGTYKGKLNLVPENSIIYSKINVRHGCVYYHKVGKVPFGVSTEYPTFTFDETKINGYYLKRILRSNEFKKLLNTKTSGISKARVKVDEFLEIKIPLPSLSEQNKIVAAYNKKIELAEKQEEKANKLEKDIHNYIDKELGIKKKTKKTIKEGVFLELVNFSKFNKCGLYEKSNISYQEGFEKLKISQICTVSSGGTPSRSNKEYYTGTIPWIKTGEVINDVITETEEHITTEAVKNSSAKLYKKNSLIIAMYGQGKTRGRTAKLGIDATTNQACAVLHEINNSKILTDFLWLFLLNEYDRLRELASGNSQPNLNAQMIKNYNVVIPTLNIQQKIINKISTLKAEIKDLKEQAARNRDQAIIDFENEIFKTD